MKHRKLPLWCLVLVQFLAPSDTVGALPPLSRKELEDLCDIHAIGTEVDADNYISGENDWSNSSSGYRKLSRGTNWFLKSMTISW